MAEETSDKDGKKKKPERDDGKPVNAEDLKKSEKMCPKCRRSVWDCTCK